MKLKAIPRDDRLPGLNAMLDIGRVRKLLEVQFTGSSMTITDCRVDHVRYRRGRFCTASYVVRTHDQSNGRQEELIWYSRCMTAEVFARVHKRVSNATWTKPRIGSAVTTLPRYQAMLFAYPNDFELEGLRIAADHDALSQVLSHNVCDGSPACRWRTTLVRYKPEHLAVLSGQLSDASSAGTPSESRVYVKVYLGDEGSKVYGAMVRLTRFLGPQSTLVIPSLLGFDARHRMLVLGVVPGVQLRSLRGKAREGKVYARVGESLARLHEYRDEKLPCFTVHDRWLQTKHTLDWLQQHAPALRHEIQQLKRRMKAQAPQDDDNLVGFVHGDLVPGNIFVTRSSIGLIDLDKASTGCVAADIGKFLAHLRGKRHRGRRDGTSLGDAFLESYCKASGRKLDGAVLGWWTAAGILQRVRKQFRQLEPGRQKTVERLLHDAAELLDEN